MDKDDEIDDDSSSNEDGKVGEDYEFTDNNDMGENWLTKFPVFRYEVLECCN